MISNLLREKPYLFEFFQAVRLLELSSTSPEKNLGEGKLAPGLKARYNDELVYFKNNPKLSFNASDIQKLEFIDPQLTDDDRAAWKMTVSILGLVGSQGVMPQYFSESVLLELRRKNTDLVDFINFIEHRAVSLFYQSWAKYQLPVNYERSKRTHQHKRDVVTHSLLSLLGLGTEELMYRQIFSDETLISCAGFISRPTVTAEGIAKIIKHQFGFDSEIKQFVCQWQELPEDLLTRLPGAEVPKGQNNILGQNTLLGRRCYNTQGKFSVVIDGDQNKNYERLAPGSKTLMELQSMLKFVCGSEFEFAIEIILPTDTYYETQLSESTEPLLGWNTRLRASDYSSNERESVVLSQDIHSPSESLPLVQ